MMCTESCFSGGHAPHLVRAALYLRGIESIGLLVINVLGPILVVDIVLLSLLLVGFLYVLWNEWHAQHSQ